MSDLIGQIRREEHEPAGSGYSIWVCVGYQMWDPPSKSYVLGDWWVCAYSTTDGNCGESLNRGDVAHVDFPVVGTIPGTPAADKAAAS